MTNLTEIETAIKELPKNKIQQLAEWQNLDDDWDRQIETDFTQEKLDQLIAKAEIDIINNRVKDINKMKSFFN